MYSVNICIYVHSTVFDIYSCTQFTDKNATQGSHVLLHAYLCSKTLFYGHRMHSMAILYTKLTSHVLLHVYLRKNGQLHGHRILRHGQIQQRHRFKFRQPRCVVLDVTACPNFFKLLLSLPQKVPIELTFEKHNQIQQRHRFEFRQTRCIVLDVTACPNFSSYYSVFHRKQRHRFKFRLNPKP